ncbi:hypothetical protein NHJ13734_008809 [Beauveria thailandica]
MMNRKRAAPSLAVTASSAASLSASYYAVAVGSPTGIFNEWDDAAEAIKGIKGLKYKRFSSRAKAVDYIQEYGSMEAVIALSERRTGVTTGGIKI